MSKDIISLKPGDSVRLRGVPFYREPDSVTFKKETEDQLYFNAVYTYAKPPREQYRGNFSIFKEAVRNGAIEIIKSNRKGRA
jgi:hypothetical protein